MTTTTDTKVAWDAAAMLDALPERVNRYRFDDLTITYCNAAWASQYGVEPAAALGRPLDQFLSDDELVGLRSQLLELGPDNPVITDTTPRAVSNASSQWLQWVDRYLPGPDGPEVLSVGRDVSDRHLAEARLVESEARYRDLAEKSSDIVWRIIVDSSPHFDYLSPAVEHVLGYPASYFIGDFDRTFDVVDEAGRAAIAQALRVGDVPDRFDCRMRHANGSTVVCETRTTRLRLGLQGVTRDVTELRTLQDAMTDLAFRDPMTGLANRRRLDELLETGIIKSKRSGVPLAVAYVDVDGLKQVNDTYGHDAGDQVLVETARRLTSTVRGADVVARVGGDEFVVVYELNRLHDDRLPRRLHAALAVPIALHDGTVVCCTASIGVSDTRSAGLDPQRLIETADRAMYQTKRGRRCPTDA